jgi:hypothetical protein
MKQIITLFLALSSFFVNAQTNFKEAYIGETSESKLYLNVESIKESFFGDENGKYIEFWVKEKYKTSHKINGKIYKTPFIQTKYLVDCSHSKCKILSEVSYTSTGKVIKSKKYDEYESFEDVAPDSVGELILDSACKFNNYGK